MKRLLDRNPLLNSSSGNCEPNQVYFRNQRDGGQLIPRSVFPNYIAVILVINIRRFLSCIISIDVFCSIIYC